MIQKTHWHVMAGLCGCMPAYSSIADSEDSARDNMRWYLDIGCDHCELSKTRCVIHDYTVRFDTPIIGYCSFEYLEIYPCSDDCLTKEELESLYE